MRLGIFGGSFDPVHYGHLLLAETAREQAALDEVWFMPAATPPHKRHRALAPDEARVAMLELALGGHPALKVSTLELDRGGVSYTVETLEALARDDPGRELFLLIGGDSLAELPTWREPERILALATPVVVRRPGAEEPRFDRLAGLVDAARMAEFRRHVVDMPQIDLSSRELRRRVAQGRSIRFQTPRAVEAYIAEHGLYRHAEPGE